MRILAAAIGLALGVGQPANAAWTRAETDHFILYSEANEKSLRAEGVKLERFNMMMRLLTGAKDSGEKPVRLTVYFVRTPEQARALLPGKARQVAGFYIPSAEGALAVVPRMINAPEAASRYTDIEDVVLFHEYTHHLMLQYFPSAYPAWYVEGLAEYVGNSKIEDDGSVKLGLPNLPRAYTLTNRPKFPLLRLLTTRVADIQREEVSAFYARSWLLVHYLEIDPARSAQLRTFLDAVRSGTGGLDAARAAFGDLTALDKALDRYLTQRMMSYRTISSKLASPTNIVVQPLDAAASDAVLPALRLKRGTPVAEREALAAELRKLNLRYPDDARLLTLLAEAELDLRNFAASEAAADAALRIAPKESRTLLWKGLSQARALSAARNRDGERWKTARSWIVRANRANTEDPLPLIAYFRSFVDAGIAAPEVAVKGLDKALSLVPQNRNLRLTYARALAGQRKFDDARVVLEPVANDPHGGGASEAAVRLLARIDAAKKAGSADAIKPDEPGAETP